VPINTKIIKTGIASRDSRGKSAQSLPNVPRVPGVIDLLGVLSGEFICL
jgi:hypothetical protein